jgi:hypothetical protein
MTKHSIEHDIVLGNPELSFKDTLENICKTLKIKRWVKVSVSSSFILFVINLFRIKVDNWGRYCIKHPYFRYKVHSPKDFGLAVSYPTISDVIKEMHPV